MAFLTNFVFLDEDVVEDDDAKRTREVAKYVSVEAALSSKEWLSRRSPPSRDGAALYLTVFGYKAADGYRWKPTCAARPQLDIGITMHAEINNHTWYLISCSLSLEGTAGLMEWQTARRLCHLRKFWYDHVKREFGPEYGRLFAHAPFAHHGAILGTTSRLNAWCKEIAACINRGIASPYIVALTLRILDAPHLRALDEWLGAADVGIDTFMRDAVQQQAETIKPDIFDKENVSPYSGNLAVLDQKSCEGMDLFQIDMEFEDSRLDMAIQDSKAFCIPRPDVGEGDLDVGEGDELNAQIDSDAEQVVQYLRTIANGPILPTMKSDGDDISMPILPEGDMSSPCRVTDVHTSQSATFGSLPIIEEEKTDLTWATSATQPLADGVSAALTESATKGLALTLL